MIVYNGQAFNTTTEFKDAYAAGSINKTIIRPDKTWTGFSRQGEPFPGDDMVGSRYTEPRGKRFNISGNHIEYMGWKFDWSITPLSGSSSHLPHIAHGRDHI
jgi:diamine oxidase